MKKWWGETSKKFHKEIRAHRFVYFLLAITLLGGLFIRTYRTDQILGFYYDQGRDAKVIWDLWHDANFFLIGPTTGIAGIFRGPFYYYLIAPFYLLSGGNPLGPSYFLAFLSMVAVALMYYLGAKMQDRATGLFAALLGSFSFYIMVASRWLSNPTPMLLLSMILVWMLFVIHDAAYKPQNTKAHKYGQVAWVVLALVAGSSLLHFGSAGEFFYFPALFIFFVWQLYRNSWNFTKVMKIPTLLLALGAFLFTALPQIAFDFLKGHILSQNIKKFFVEDESFKSDFWIVAQERANFYYSVFTSKVFHWIRKREEILLIVVALAFVGRLPKLLKNDYVKIIILILLSPIIGLLFFQGNFGNIYDYYMTGYYLIFLLLFAVVLGQLWKFKLGKLFVIFFFYVFLSWNGMVTRYHIIAGVDGPHTIAFGNQIQSIERVFEDADGRTFNTDVYVPPVIPHAYDYLFTWYGTTQYGHTPAEEHVDLLYTVYEVDPPHPERLEAWLQRQATIGSVEETWKYGGITVERRKRFNVQTE